MRRAVLDTNIIISAIHFGGKPAEVLNLAIEHKGSFFISREIIAEVLGVLTKKFAYEKEAIEEIEELLAKTFVLVESKKTIQVIKNCPADNRILECGLAGEVNFIVSGDKRHLLLLKKYQQMEILSAEEFLKIYG